VERALTGRVALVTGGGTRLGQAIALGLGRLGADVAVHYASSKAGAKDTAQRIAIDGNRADCFQADLTKVEDLKTLATQVRDVLGPVDILVNSAAGFAREAFEKTSLETLDGQWALNARAPYLLTQAVLPQMREKGRGDVVNIVDIGGVFDAWSQYSAYCMSKAALAALTRSLAVELAPLVRVNAVAPGTVLPPVDLGPETLEALRQRIPQKRFGSPEDVVATVGFLLTGPTFVTGQIVAVDGGRSLG